jgi:hypothetical protein
MKFSSLMPGRPLAEFIMRSPLAALAWEIWQRSRRSTGLAFGCVIFCALVNLSAPERFAASEAGHAVYGLLMVVSFLLLMGTFNYTEFNPTREWNGFPYRLFVLPVRTWLLVTLPMLLGVVSVELLYVAWIKLVWTHANIPTPGWFAAILGAYMLFYLTVIWSLAGFRITRIVLLGLGGCSSIAVACLPMYDKISPSPWFEEKRLTLALAAAAVIAYAIALTAVTRQRCGGGLRRSRFKLLFDRLADVLPHRRANFSSSAAAQFWFEWRRAGLLLPACTALALVAIIAPYTWIYRHDPNVTEDVLIRILAVPLVLSFAVGKGFIKPEFWTMNLALPPFLATRPLSSGDFVISKLKVAALSVAITWLLVLGFIALWLSLWADTSQLNEAFDIFRLFFFPRSWPAVVAMSAAALMILSWRCLVSGLWAGLSGKSGWYFGSLGLQVIVPVLLLIAAGICSNKIDSQIQNHPVLIISFAISLTGWLLALAVIAKMWGAVFAWSNLNPRRARQYLLVWSGVTLCFIALALSYPEVVDTYRLKHLAVLGALLLFPLARLGLAPASLSKNRHR